MRKLKKRQIRNIILTVVIVITAIFLALIFKDKFLGSSDSDSQEIANEYNVQILSLRNEKMIVENKIDELEAMYTEEILPTSYIIVETPKATIYESVKNMLVSNNLKYAINVPTSYFNEYEAGFIGYTELSNHEMILSIDTNDLVLINDIISKHDIVGIYIPSYIDPGLDLSKINTDLIFEHAIDNYKDENDKYHLNYIISDDMSSSSDYVSNIENGKDIGISVKNISNNTEDCIIQIVKEIENNKTELNDSKGFIDNYEDKLLYSYDSINEYKQRLEEINQEIHDLESLLKTK